MAGRVLLVDEIAQMIRVANNRVGAGQLAEDILSKAEPYFTEKGRQVERNGCIKRMGFMYDEGVKHERERIIQALTQKIRGASGLAVKSGNNLTSSQAPEGDR